MKPNIAIYQGALSPSYKTFVLALYQLELLARGYRVIFIDPLGSCYDLIENWFSYIACESYKGGTQQFSWFKESVLAHTIFLDLSDKEHPYRHNMLKPCAYANEDLQDVIARLTKFANCIFGGASEQAMATQLQRRTNFINMAILFIATDTPLEQGLEFIYNADFRKSTINKASQKSGLFEVQKAVKHWQYLEQEFKGSKFTDHINSLETGLSIFYENPSVRKFLLSGEDNVPDFAEILNTKLLFVKLPVSDIPTRTLLLQYFTNIFLDLADKRPADATPVFLGSDESSLVMNFLTADYICRIRNKKVYLIHSHQSVGQMLTPEGMKIAETIASQSANKFIFRHDAKEAEDVAKQMFSPQGKKPKMVEISMSISHGTGESTGTNVSESISQSQGIAQGKSIGEQTSESSTQSYSLSDSWSIGESLAKSWSEAESLSDTVSFSVNKAFSWSENKNKGISQLKGGSVSFTQGKGDSVITINTENESFSIGESQSESHSQSEGDGRSESSGQGKSYSVNSSQGNSTTIPYPTRGTISSSAGNSRGVSGNISEAFSNFRQISNSVSKGTSQNKSQGRSWGKNFTLSNQESLALAKNFSETENLAKSIGKSLQNSMGESQAYGSSLSHTRGITDTTSRQISKAVQQGESIARSVAKNWAENISKNQSQSKSQTTGSSESKSISSSLSYTWKMVFYTMQEEYMLHTQEVKDLPRRHFFLSIDGRAPIKVYTKNVFLLPHTYGKYNFLTLLRKHFENLPFDNNKSFELFETEIQEQPQQTVFIKISEEDFEHFFPRE